MKRASLPIVDIPALAPLKAATPESAAPLPSTGHRSAANQHFRRRPFAALLVTIVLVGPAALVLASPAAADPVGSSRLTASGTETTTTSDTESVATWNYDVTWNAAPNPELPGLVGTSLATATGTIYYDMVTTSHHVWFPPPDFGPEQVTCRTQTTTTWSGTVEPSPELFFSPEIRVDPAGTDGLYNVSSRVWIEGQAAQRLQLSFSGSEFNPFCNASLDETNPTNFHLDGRDEDVTPAPTTPASLSGSSTIGEADWSGFVDPGGPATFAFDLRAGNADGVVVLNGDTSFTGSLSGAVASYTGTDRARVHGEPPAALGAVSLVCIRQVWTATIKLSTPSTVPLFWNGAAHPFDADGWNIVEPPPLPRKGAFKGMYTETVTVDKCDAPTDVVLAGVVVTGPGQMVSLTHAATMSAYGINNQLLGTTNVPQTKVGKKGTAFITQVAPEVRIPVQFN
jgi:hypothetical protein